MPSLATRFPALASRDFRIFWIGQFVSLIGTWMQSTTQPYLAYRLTGQPIYLGLVGFAATLPTLLFTLPGGVFIERLDKRKVVIIMQTVMMVQAFTLAALALSGLISIWHIIALAFVLGSANSIEITARQSMLIELVGKEALPSAIALQSTIFNTARVLGPALAAPFLLLLGNRGEGWAFFANGVSYLFVIVGLFIARTHPQTKPETPRKNALGEFMDGQHFIRQTPVVLALILMATVLGFFAFPFTQQIPVVARVALAQPGDTQAAVAARNSALLTAQGIGALIAAITLALFSAMRHRGRLLTAAQTIFGLAFISLALAKSFWLALPIMMLIGWGTVTQLANTNTLIQLNVPDHLRGRVISTYLWSLQGIAPFGSLFIGWVVQNLSLQTALLLTGSMCLLSVVALNLYTPTLRQVET